MPHLECCVYVPVAPPRAYEAWTIGWASWFACDDTLRVVPEVGAPFFFERLAPAEGERSERRIPCYGRFLALVPTACVRFTWVTDAGGTAGTETVVTISLAPHRDGGTTCTLTHEGFATAEARDRHAEWWRVVLAEQAARLATVSEDAWQEARERFGRLPANRSMPDAAFLPTRSYPDMDAAVDWLEHVLGCRERLRVPSDRVQLTLGDGAVVVAAWDPASAPASGGRPPATLLVRVADVDAAWARALARGATGLSAPVTQPFGERQALVRDPAGHAWMLSQTVADVDPAQWGALPAVRR